MQLASRLNQRCCLQHTRFQLYWSVHKSESVMVICSTCVLALLYNIVHAALIHKISATTVTVLGEVKIIGVLLLSAWILGKQHQRQLAAPMHFCVFIASC